MASQQLQVYKDPSIVKNVPQTDLERLQLALDAKAPGYQMTPTNSDLASALGGKDASQLLPVDQSSQMPDGQPFAYGPGIPAPPGLAAVNDEIGNNPWYSPGLLSAYMRSTDKDNFFDKYRPGGKPAPADMNYILRNSPDLSASVDRSMMPSDPYHGQIGSANGKDYQYIQMTGGDFGKPDENGKPATWGWQAIAPPKDTDSGLGSLLSGFRSLFGGHATGTPPIGSQTLRSGLSALFAGSAPGEPTSRSIMDAERNRVAATDPRRGQTVQTVNHGQQVAGQRLNGSNRGMTVTGDNWFNSVRGL